MSNNHGRNLSVFVVGACLFVPMGMYIDSQNKTRELIKELYVAEQGGTGTDSDFLNRNYVLESDGGRGGPAVGIDAVLEGGSLAVDNSGNPVDVVRIESEDQSELNTSDNTRKVVHLKIAETVWPVEEVSISSDFGWRTAPCEGCSSDHQGVDFVPGAGTNVFSVYQGIVVNAGWYGGYGNHVEIKHYVQNDEGVVEEWRTLYAHLQSDSIPENIYVGAVVDTGQIIGKVGSTGLSTGPHLHFELLIEGENVDPMPVLGHYELVEMTEEELREYAFVNDLPELTFNLED